MNGRPTIDRRDLDVAPGGQSVHCDGIVHIYPVDGADVVALRGVDLDIAAGERIAILGPSGCGKSTLLNLLAGLLKPSAGALWIGRHDIVRLPERELLRLRAITVGIVLQGAGRNLMPYATAAQNVAFAQRAVPSAQRRGLHSPHDLLDLLGLSTVAGQRLGSLSGGEQQRVAVAVAVANQPGVLLADEPTSQLDRDSRTAVLDLLDTVNTELNTTVVVVTHDPDVGARMGRTISMRNGRVGAEGLLGEQFAVIGKDGSLHLPDALSNTWPPGSLVRVEPDGDALRITRRQP